MSGGAEAVVGRRHSRRRILLGGVLLVLLTFSYSYFFTERLPWFWYDDINRLERAERSNWPELIRETFDFASPNFATERPVLQIFAKFSLALFGEDPHLHRVFKLVLFCGALVGLYFLQVRNKVHWVIAAGGLLLASTFPSVMLVTAWVYESASLELVFKVGAIALFFSLMRREEKGLTARALASYVLLLLLVILADHAKATGKVIPVVFLTTLVIVRSRQVNLFVVSILALVAVIPYGILFGQGMPGVRGGTFLPQLLLNFGGQTGWVALGLLLAIMASRHLVLPKDRYHHLLFCWWICEMVFYFAYPSSELRYLYSSLIAAVMFGTALISYYFEKIEHRITRLGFVFGYCLISLMMFAFDTRWNDSFRGDWGGEFILVDHKIRALNARYKNSLFLYGDFNILYYERNTTNRYVNINQPNSWGLKYEDIYGTAGKVIYIKNHKRFDRMLFLDKMTTSYAEFPTGIYYGVIGNSLWDFIHQKFKFDLWKTSMYDLNYRGPGVYPKVEGVYRVGDPVIYTD